MTSWVRKMLTLCDRRIEPWVCNSFSLSSTHRQEDRRQQTRLQKVEKNLNDDPTMSEILIRRAARSKSHHKGEKILRIRKGIIQMSN